MSVKKNLYMKIKLNIWESLSVDKMLKLLLSN